jgi:hypothetical protein
VTTPKPLTAYGPLQLAERLGLTIWQRDRALAAGDIPPPDRAGGKWSAKVVDGLAERALEIASRAGWLPDCGAWRAAEYLSDRLGVVITADAIQELRRAGHLTPIGKFKGAHLYDGRVIAVWTDADALVEAERVGKMLTTEQAIVRMKLRDSDFAHLIRAGLLRPRGFARGQWASTVALYRTGDIDDLLASDAIDWAAVQSTPRRRRSLLADLPTAKADGRG